MEKPKICAVIVDKDLTRIKEIEELVDLLEVRIDLIGDGWQELVKQLNKPWIACNRIEIEGGKWKGSEAERIEELLKAIELGADTIDLELRTSRLTEIVSLIKNRAKCLLSFHDLIGTPRLEEVIEVVQRQLAAGADVCKVVTTAQKFEDNFTVLELISEFPGTKIVSFAMGNLGLVSRILCPFFGGYFTYASIGEGKESAPGQITVRNLRKIYEIIAKCLAGQYQGEQDSVE